MRNALLRYRVVAYVVGTLLIVLTCIGVPLKYFAGNDSVVGVVGTAHGFLYMVLIITAVDLGFRAKWTWKRLLLIALAGTVPFLSFVAERSATKNVRPKIEAERRAAAASTQ
ncbi:integral membrane protein [Friedmanniella endophytica]|uniref:Integral membrane protein n=1 Tax=Microlunatus kandeliicorticis TaxID=1759536 RepID=A0A7W3IQZ6_9ACTN|nr:integral membrane protein [Microlunatus kandeliicorticis]